MKTYEEVKPLYQEEKLSPDYTRDIYSSTGSLYHLAAYIRACACQHAATFDKYSDEDRLGIVKQGEEHAKAIEKCHDSKEAHHLLAVFGYLDI